MFYQLQPTWEHKLQTTLLHRPAKQTAWFVFMVLLPWIVVLGTFVFSVVVGTGVLDTAFLVAIPPSFVEPNPSSSKKDTENETPLDVTQTDKAYDA